jgi:two-component system, OmpR family, sensor histidine kinase TctE
MTNSYSIKRRILTSAVFVLVGVGLITAFMIRQQASQAAEEAYDRVLGAAALSIADTIALQDETVTIDIPHAAFAILGTSQLNRIFYRIVAPGGGHVTGSSILGIEIPLGQTRQINFHDSSFKGTPVRVVKVSRYRGGVNGGGWFNVFVGETMEAREALESELAFQAFVPVVLLSLTGIVLIFAAVRFSFQPLHSLEEAIRKRSPSDLTPIKRKVPVEIHTLVFAINEFMDRLHSTLDGLGRVTADAAHQLRTPLTAMRALAEVTLDDVPGGPLRNKLVRIEENAIAATDLANQLLAEATLLHRLETVGNDKVDIAILIQQVISKVSAEYRHRLSLPEIVFHQDNDSDAFVIGDPVALSEMFKNLLENALIHASGPIAFELERSQQCLVIRLADRGPGIPEDVMEKVFERFFKGTGSKRGSGLGLAIARQVALASGGDIKIRNREGGGLVTEVFLPEASSKRTSQRTTFRFSFLFAFLASLFLSDVEQVFAESLPNTFHILHDAPQTHIQKVAELVRKEFPDLKVQTSKMYPSQIALKVSTRSPDVADVDMVLLRAPDLGVQLANEGYLQRFPGIAATISGYGSGNHWRHEVFAFAKDPALVVVRTKALGEKRLPKTRLELAQYLEGSEGIFEKRVGLANIGIDSVGYALAVQDVLRSPLFWRVARAFGAANARIYDSSAEVMDALINRNIDLAYNMPLSDIQANDMTGLEVVIPEDYVIALPWVLFVPATVKENQQAEAVLRFLVTRGDLVLPMELSDRKIGAETVQSMQDVNIGPELLAFLDPIKKTLFLDNWLEMVVR